MELRAAAVMSVKRGAAAAARRRVADSHDIKVMLLQCLRRVGGVAECGAARRWR